MKLPPYTLDLADEDLLQCGRVISTGPYAAERAATRKALSVRPPRPYWEPRELRHTKGCAARPYEPPRDHAWFCKRRHQ